MSGAGGGAESPAAGGGAARRGKSRPSVAATLSENCGKPSAARGVWTRASAVCFWKAASPTPPRPATSVVRRSRAPRVGRMASSSDAREKECFSDDFAERPRCESTAHDEVRTGTWHTSRSPASYDTSWQPPGSAAWPTAALTLAVCPFSEYDDFRWCERTVLQTSACSLASAPPQRGFVAYSRKVLLLCCPASISTPSTSARPNRLRTRTSASIDPSPAVEWTPVEAVARRCLSETVTTTSASGMSPCEPSARARSTAKSAASKIWSDSRWVAATAQAAWISPRLEAVRSARSSLRMTDSWVCSAPRTTSRCTRQGVSGVAPGMRRGRRGAERRRARRGTT
mmetsp:Transcript_33774/g.111712  ORF Transcript_33774/g.111712 Transcript_33774/m.111712 type:complete len:342 (-) Transcript_33774:76-1101(-)